MRRPSRTGPVAFVAWTSAPERATEIARALHGVAFVHYPLGHVKGLAPARYALSAILTLLFLARHRPRAVIVTNPPIFPALVALTYARLAGIPMLLDSHPGGFGLQGDRLSARMQPLVRWVAARAAATLVTESSLKGVVEAWGGRAEIVHEAPPEWTIPTAAPTGDQADVLFVCTFNRDEPVEALVAAARLLPEVTFSITGETRKAPVGLLERAPGNVRFVGFLRGDDYTRALASCALVVALTTEPTSVVKAGYEAVYAERPLLLSDWPAACEAFPEAVLAANTGSALAEGIAAALRDLGGLAARAASARVQQELRWAEQLRTLERLVGV